MPGFNPTGIQINLRKLQEEIYPKMTEEQRYRFEERIGILTDHPTRQPTPEEIQLALKDAGITI